MNASIKYPKGWDSLLDIVCESTEISKEDIFKKTRKKEIVLSRRLFCVLAMKTICRNMSQEGVSDLMGNDWSDRSILSYYYRCHLNDIKVNKEYKVIYRNLLDKANKIKLEGLK